MTPCCLFCINESSSTEVTDSAGVVGLIGVNYSAGAGSPTAIRFVPLKYFRCISSTFLFLAANASSFDFCFFRLSSLLH